MRLSFGYTLFAVALVSAGVAGVCIADTRLSYERSGLGLRPWDANAESVGEFSGSDHLPPWAVKRASDFTLYGGARDVAPLGPGSTEAYGGISYAPRRGWGSSLEAGYVHESLFAPRRYALAGQVQRTLGQSRAMSVGIRYRVYDTDTGARADAPFTNGYTLAPSRAPGASSAPGYSVQFSYQHSVSSSFGLALARDVDFYTPAWDVAGSYARQLTFTGQHWLTPSWALSYDVLSSDPANPLRLQGIGLRLGVRYRF